MKKVKSALIGICLFGSVANAQNQGGQVERPTQASQVQGPILGAPLPKNMCKP